MHLQEEANLGRKIGGAHAEGGGRISFVRGSGTDEKTTQEARVENPEEIDIDDIDEDDDDEVDENDEEGSMEVENRNGVDSSVDRTAKKVAAANGVAIIEQDQQRLGRKRKQMAELEETSDVP